MIDPIQYLAKENFAIEHYRLQCTSRQLFRRIEYCLNRGEV